MKNRRIEIALSKTINTGNFENTKIHASLSVQIDDEQDLREAFKEAKTQVYTELLKLEKENTPVESSHRAKKIAPRTPSTPNTDW